MKLTCPECKNEIDLLKVVVGGEVKKDQVVECPTCGISLVVTAIGPDGTISVEIADEGK